MKATKKELTIELKNEEGETFEPLAMSMSISIGGWMKKFKIFGRTVRISIAKEYTGIKK